MIERGDGVHDMCGGSGVLYLEEYTTPNPLIISPYEKVSVREHAHMHMVLSVCGRLDGGSAAEKA